jgi:hypothetical protein
MYFIDDRIICYRKNKNKNKVEAMADGLVGDLGPVRPRILLAIIFLTGKSMRYDIHTIIHDRADPSAPAALRHNTCVAAPMKKHRY